MSRKSSTRNQGSQFTSGAFTTVLKDNDIAISMDGKGRWMDNVFIERLWRSVKYEEVYLTGYDSIPEARRELGRYFEFETRSGGTRALIAGRRIWFTGLPPLKNRGRHN